MNNIKKTIACILAVSLTVPSSFFTYADNVDDYTNDCIISNSPFADNIECDPAYCPSYEKKIQKTVYLRPMQLSRKKKIVLVVGMMATQQKKTLTSYGRMTNLVVSQLRDGTAAN